MGPRFKPLPALQAPLTHATPQSCSAAPGCQRPQFFLLEMWQSCLYMTQAAPLVSKEKGLILPAWLLGSRFKSPQMLALGMFP